MLKPKEHDYFHQDGSLYNTPTCTLIVFQRER